MISGKSNPIYSKHAILLQLIRKCELTIELAQSTVIEFFQQECTSFSRLDNCYPSWWEQQCWIHRGQNNRCPSSGRTKIKRPAMSDHWPVPWRILKELVRINIKEMIRFVLYTVVFLWTLFNWPSLGIEVLMQQLINLPYSVWKQWKTYDIRENI